MSVRDIIQAAAGGAVEQTDPYFENTVLLLHGDGTNGGQNNTFIDSSSNNFTITRNGNTTQGSFSPYGNLWSNYFDGGGDYLTAPSNAAFDITGDFTIEVWGYFTADPAINGNGDRVATFCSYSDGSTANAGWEFYVDFTQNIFVLASWGSNTNLVSCSFTPQKNTWYHLSVTKSSSTTRMFINGVSQTLVVNNLTINNGVSPTLNISRGSQLSSYLHYLPGYLSNLRVVKGTAVYTSSFTPPTTPLTAISGTSLLTCQSNNFKDNSSNNFTLTRNGDVRVTNFDPFAPSAAYSASTNGASGYFPSTSDYLQTPSFTFGTNPFTLECWMYFGGNFTSRYDFLSMADQGTNGFATVIENGQVEFRFTGTTDIQTTATVAGLGWTHIAIVREGTGTDQTKIYLNGVQSAVGTVSTNYGASKLNIAGDRSSDGGNGLITTYLSDVRIFNNTALYTSNFTPPTSPLTSVSGTSLLLNFTNAAIFDNTQKNDLETVGNAQISTSMKKYGTGSIAFDGTGDALSVPHNNLLVMDASDFTVECWINFNAKSSFAVIVNKTGQNNVSVANWVLNLNSAGAAFVFAIGQTSTSGAGTWISSALLTSTTNPNTGTWYHVAVTKSGTTYRMFVNGALEATATNTTVPSDARQGALSIGSTLPTTDNNINGYIDDLRITKGVARYTANFTPPTKAFPNT